jgi:hypothetical protein
MSAFFSAKELVWINIEGSVVDEMLPLLVENKLFPVVDRIVDRDIFEGGFVKADAERVVAYLKNKGIKEIS